MSMLAVVKGLLGKTRKGADEAGNTVAEGVELVVIGALGLWRGLEVWLGRGELMASELACSLVLMRSRGLPIKIPTAPLI